MLYEVHRMLQRALARYLRRQGWAVFWLDEGQRTCTAGVCWMAAYGHVRRQAVRKGDTHGH